VCGLKLEPAVNICVLAVYRAPSGNFISFLSGLDIISSLYKAESKFIICGDINIDYLTENEKESSLILCFCPTIYHHQSPEPILYDNR
jgi:hypothetical protein